MKIVTIYEAMEKTGKSYRQIYYAAKITKKIKAKQVNGVWLIPESELKKLMKD